MIVLLGRSIRRGLGYFQNHMWRYLLSSLWAHVARTIFRFPALTSATVFTKATFATVLPSPIKPLSPMSAWFGSWISFNTFFSRLQFQNQLTFQGRCLGK
jgi:hypothetical protein